MPQHRPNGHTAYRTRQAVDEVTEALKLRYREQRALVAVARAAREQNRIETIPVRKPVVTKLNSFNAVLAQCPGGARDEARTGAYAAYLKQIDHPETGCIVVAPETKKGAATMQRLARSSTNANTTKR